MLRFDWNERKNKSNRAKHDVWFEEAQSAFGRMLVVVHCYREADSLVRIISARKATKKEIRVYEERI